MNMKKILIYLIIISLIVLGAVLAIKNNEGKPLTPAPAPMFEQVDGCMVITGGQNMNVTWCSTEASIVLRHEDVDYPIPTLQYTLFEPLHTAMSENALVFQFIDGHLTVEYSFTDGVLIRPTFTSAPIMGMANTGFNNFYCVWELTSDSKTAYALNAVVRGMPYEDDSCENVVLTATPGVGERLVTAINAQSD